MALDQSDKDYIKTTIAEVVRPIVDDGTESLVAITKRGFDAVDKRFDRVESSLENLEGDMRDIKFRLAETANRTELLSLTQRVGRLEDAVFRQDN